MRPTILIIFLIVQAYSCLQDKPLLTELRQDSTFWVKAKVVRLENDSCYLKLSDSPRPRLRVDGTAIMDSVLYCPATRIFVEPLDSSNLPTKETKIYIRLYLPGAHTYSEPIRNPTGIKVGSTLFFSAPMWYRDTIRNAIGIDFIVQSHNYFKVVDSNFVLPSIKPQEVIYEADSAISLHQLLLQIDTPLKSDIKNELVRKLMNQPYFRKKGVEDFKKMLKLNHPLATPREIQILLHEFRNAVESSKKK